MIYLIYFIFGFLALRLLVSLVNLVLPTRLPHSQTEQAPMVSVLIPARNEDKNIGQLLWQLGNSQYENLEILVYDDHSEDYTASIVQEIATGDRRIRLLQSEELPSGWLGKNHACHQLAQQAKGDYLLFLDADVMVKPPLIADALAYLQKHQLQLLSIFPKQQMISIGEKITVPLMNWILTSLLPLPLIKAAPQASLAAANGQFMLFDANNYRHNQWHERFKQHAVEDIYIMKAIKKTQNRGHTLLSNGQISCRMYSGFNDAANGFAKNTHAFFGGSHLLMTLFSLLSTFGFIPVIVYGGMPLFAAYLLMSILLRVFTSISSKQNITQNILLAPFQQLALLNITYRSILNKVRGYGVWKGRRMET